VMQAQVTIYNEIGIGNDWFLSHEIEIGDTETRHRGWHPIHLTQIYFRLWIGRRVLILNSKNGLVLQRKSKNRFKLIFGLAGRPKG
jgi:hypothetical protein